MARCYELWKKRRRRLIRSAGPLSDVGSRFSNWLMDAPPSLGGILGALAWTAIRSFVGTMIVFFVAGLFLAASSYYFSSDRALVAMLMAAVALATSLAAGIVVGVKCALALALVHGASEVRLGRTAV